MNLFLKTFFISAFFLNVIIHFGMIIPLVSSKHNFFIIAENTTCSKQSFCLASFHFIILVIIIHLEFSL